MKTAVDRTQLPSNVSVIASTNDNPIEIRPHPEQDRRAVEERRRA
jgi:hypothetical protein